MNCRKLLVLFVALAFALLWLPLCAQSAPQQAQRSQPAPYRIIHAVSSSMAQQKIAEAAADGYRVISMVPTNSFQPAPVLPGQTEDVGGSGLTIVLHRSALKRYEYRLLVFKETSDLKKALNQYGAEGFRLLPSSVLMAWAEQQGMELLLDPETYSSHQNHRFDLPVALMEKASADTLKYSYQIAKPGEIPKLGARGYYPVGGDVFWNLVILESQTPARNTTFKIQHSRLARFNTRSSTRPEITRDTTSPLPTEVVAVANNEEEPAPEIDVKLDKAVLAGRKLILLNDGLAGMTLAPAIEAITESDAPDTPASYRLLIRNDITALEKAVNESAAQGFRLFPTIATAYRKNTRLHGTRALGVFPTLDVQTTLELQRVMAIMYPAVAGSTHNYRIVSAHSPVDLLKALNTAEADGFRFVSLWRGTLVVESERHAGASQ